MDSEAALSDGQYCANVDEQTQHRGIMCRVPALVIKLIRMMADPRTVVRFACCNQGIYGICLKGRMLAERFRWNDLANYRAWEKNLDTLGCTMIIWDQFLEQAEEGKMEMSAIVECPLSPYYHDGSVALIIRRLLQEGISCFALSQIGVALAHEKENTFRAHLSIIGDTERLSEACEALCRQTMRTESLRAVERFRGQLAGFARSERTCVSDVSRALQAISHPLAQLCQALKSVPSDDVFVMSCLWGDASASAVSATSAASTAPVGTPVASSAAEAAVSARSGQIALRTLKLAVSRSFCVWWHVQIEKMNTLACLVVEMIEQHHKNKKDLSINVEANVWFPTRDEEVVKAPAFLSFEVATALLQKRFHANLEQEGMPVNIEVLHCEPWVKWTVRMCD